MQAEIKTRKSLFRTFCLINKRSVHFRTHTLHAKLLQVHRLVTNIYGPVDIIEDHFFIKYLSEMGLQFKV